MSPRDWTLRVHDILTGISDVKQFVSGMSSEQFQTDKKTYLAVIRSLEVIDEAANHLPETVRNKYSEIPWRKIRDFRNVLIHEYFGVDQEIVWKTISR